jgi:hypothetical protein
VSITIFEVIGMAMMLGVAALLAIIAYDLGDDFASMDRRLDRRDARRDDRRDARRHARAGTTAPPARRSPRPRTSPRDDARV